MTARRALVVPADPASPRSPLGSPYEITWDHDDDLMPLLYRQIGCTTAEVLNLHLDASEDPPEITLWCDEEGRDRPGSTVNSRASRLAVTLLGPMPSIVGTVVLTGGADDEGDTVGLTDEVLAELQRALAPDVPVADVASIAGSAT